MLRRTVFREIASVTQLRRAGLGAMLIFHEGLLNCSRILCVSEFEFVSASVNAVFQCIWQRERDRERKRKIMRKFVCLWLFMCLCLCLRTCTDVCWNMLARQMGINGPLCVCLSVASGTRWWPLHDYSQCPTLPQPLDWLLRCWLSCLASQHIAALLVSHFHGILMILFRKSLARFGTAVAQSWLHQVSLMGSLELSHLYHHFIILHDAAAPAEKVGESRWKMIKVVWTQ